MVPPSPFVIRIKNKNSRIAENQFKCNSSNFFYDVNRAQITQNLFKNLGSLLTWLNDFVNSIYPRIHFFKPYKTFVCSSIHTPPPKVLYVSSIHNHTSTCFRSKLIVSIAYKVLQIGKKQNENGFISNKFI